METIICIQGPSQTGKTPTIRDVYAKLSKSVWPKEGDFCCIVNYKNVKVGFFSIGDPGYKQYETIKSHIENDCEIILCACRSWGHTQNDIERVAKEFDYKLIYASTYRSKNVNIDFIRKQFVSAIINLIDSCIIK